MRWLVFFLMIAFNNNLSAKEWRNLRQYQKATQKETLSPSDWLKCDRTKNTLVWQEANTFNLKNSLAQEYTNIVQRRDFYEWLYSELNKKGFDVLWVNMAHFISKKMHLTEVFPYALFSKKEVKNYALQGSETVFMNAFNTLRELYNSKLVLTEEKALEWDKRILKEEQYVWLDSIYRHVDAKSLKTLRRIAKGKFLYGLVVPKKIRFKGELANAESRYNYAIEVLRPYCERRYKR